jgi:hypothetical protein
MLPGIVFSDASKGDDNDRALGPVSRACLGIFAGAIFGTICFVLVSFRLESRDGLLAGAAVIGALLGGLVAGGGQGRSNACELRAVLHYLRV